MFAAGRDEHQNYNRGDSWCPIPPLQHPVVIY